MKNLGLLIVLLLVINDSVFSQVSINNDNSLPDNSAMFYVKATDRGLLIQRISTVSRNMIPSPATGMLIFNTTTNLFNYYNSNYWYQLEATFITSTIGTLNPRCGVSIN